MANQVTIKQSANVEGLFKASAFNDQGQPVLGPWQEFNVGSDMVWDPAKYNAPITPFYIAKGIGPDPHNQNVAYAVLVEFNADTTDATVTLDIKQVPGKNGANGCNYFSVESENVSCKVITDGTPVAETELPDRCQ